MYNVNDDKWIVIYTRSRWEKKVHSLLGQKNIVSYCPLIKTSKRWADRNKTVEMPLFNSYLFVRTNLKRIDEILQTTGVVTYITFCGQPAVIRESEIEDIKNAVKEYSNIEATPLCDLQIGDEALIVNGPLLNTRGEVREINGRSVLMIIKSMNCALTVKIAPKELLAC